ncbi:bifunctional diguanylate cyclase/phosphodiesterase [Rhizobium sp. RM]|uniref:putative bifunctional diguanylate cyclase/phosphodiesterase n=1 Tax=Rhizobium sp. RM TaxID=2748079 RepID=UPI00110DBAE7|nr:bifunctional diguanylate cyclase/phosphodiesterase [Rhizobium sp. RM]NWJ27464.1 bifunctional diguanylate cyclase/phosphodiesterase [Rhizobium sp. RM]TMV18610.1 bifunctional diguanylate cyclase/phosphodiesterase [Rhizobium sp. Td3]
MTIQLRSEWALRWVLPAFVSVMLVALIAFTLSWAASRSDELAVSRQRDLVILTVAKLKAGIAHDQESATVWDDAVKNTRWRNINWIDANLGSWMHSYFSHDVAIVLAPDLVPAYQFPADSSEFFKPEDLQNSYLALARRLQERLTAGDTSGISDKTLSIGEADVTYVGVRPAIVSVKPIISDTGSIEQVPGQEMLHVAVRFLDGDLPSMIGKEYAFSGLEFTATRPKDQSVAIVPLAARNGEIYGYFRWEPFTPGQRVLEATLPSLLISFVALFAGSSLAGGAIWRRSQRLASSRAALRHQATHDLLTGLLNRVQFGAELHCRMLEAAHDESHSVVFVDLDHFKRVNDEYGHSVGDELMVLAATRLSDFLPESVIARGEGDEFTVFLQGLDAERCEELASQLVDLFKMPFFIGTVRVAIGASVGVAFAAGSCDPVELTRQANIALYHAKTAGRDTYAVFGKHMDELLRKRRALEADLRSAVEKRIELETFYQPVFSKDGGLSSFEALVRWKHSTSGYIPPDQFIPVAEEIGLIPDIGAFVLEDACKMLVELPHITVAVNASSVELGSPDYALRVLATLNKWRVRPERLEIELTETASTNKTSEIRETISNLKAVGVRFAIDDFGTGYSSISRIQKFDVDRVKIDRSFVEEMHKSDSRALVVAMIDMAHAKGLRVTAEGVETEEQRAALGRLGCDELQGFLLSRPLPHEAALIFASRFDTGKVDRNLIYA